MLNWAVTFLVVALIAGVLGLPELPAQPHKLRGFCL